MLGMIVGTLVVSGMISGAKENKENQTLEPMIETILEDKGIALAAGDLYKIINVKKYSENQIANLLREMEKRKKIKCVDGEWTIYPLRKHYTTIENFEKERERFYYLHHPDEALIKAVEDGTLDPNIAILMALSKNNKEISEKLTRGNVLAGITAWNTLK